MGALSRPLKSTMKTTKFLIGAAAFGALLLAGCSTISSRIQDNPGLYASLPPDQQALVKQGQVGIGMDMATVKLALGDPDHVTLRTTADGKSEVWHYVSYETDEGVVLYSGYYHRWWGLNGWGAYPYYLDYPGRRVHDRFRVEFKAGRVIAVEQDAP
jgi:outer membrane protein assembly factor BamE (lipoprotein component of BamABCDE complex)